MQTEDLLVLKIHKLTQEQYDRTSNAGMLDANALYLTPNMDSIVEQSIQGRTKYRKWASGFAEIWIAKVPVCLGDCNGSFSVALPVALLDSEETVDPIQYQVTVFPSGGTEPFILQALYPESAGNTCKSVHLVFAPLADTLPYMAEIFLYVTGRWK